MILKGVYKVEEHNNPNLEQQESKENENVIEEKNESTAENDSPHENAHITSSSVKKLLSKPLIIVIVSAVLVIAVALVAILMPKSNDSKGNHDNNSGNNNSGGIVDDSGNGDENENNSDTNGSNSGNIGGGNDNVTPPDTETCTHTYGEWVTVIEPTCIEEGLALRTCECGEKEEKKLSMLMSYKLGDKVEDLSFLTDNSNVFSLYDTLEEQKAVMLVFLCDGYGYDTLKYTSIVQNKYPEVSVIGIAYWGTSENELNNRKRSLDLNISCTIDFDGLLQKKFEVLGFPTCVLIDQNAKICCVNLGVEYELEAYERAFKFCTKDNYSFAAYGSFWSIPEYSINSKDCYHAPSREVKKQATCTEYGILFGICKYCGFSVEYDYILPHEYKFDVCTICHTNKAEDTKYNVYDDYLYTQDGYNVEIIKYNGNDKNVVLPDIINGYPVTKISSDAFEGLTTTESITIPDSVRQIATDAFLNCPSLKTLNIGKNVSKISDWKFYIFKYSRKTASMITNSNTTFVRNCPMLESIVVDENNKYFASDNGILYSKDKTFLFMYPKNNPNTKFTVPDTVLSIYDNAFRNQKNIEEIIISSNTTSIGNSAFSNCSATKIIITNSINYIGPFAFSGIDDLSLYYYGTEEEWNQSHVTSSKDFLQNVTIHYNYVPEE